MKYATILPNVVSPILKYKANKKASSIAKETKTFKNNNRTLFKTLNINTKAQPSTSNENTDEYNYNFLNKELILYPPYDPDPFLFQ